MWVLDDQCACGYVLLVLMDMSNTRICALKCMCLPGWLPSQAFCVAKNVIIQHS